MSRAASPSRTAVATHAPSPEAPLPTLDARALQTEVRRRVAAQQPRPRAATPPNSIRDAIVRWLEHEL